MDNGVSWNDLVFDIGCYKHNDVNEELRRMMMVIGRKKEDTDLKPNENTFRSIMIISVVTPVDFTDANSNRSALGFDIKQ